MRAEIPAETMLQTDKCTIKVEALPDGKMRVSASAWDGAKVVMPDQVLELRLRERMSTQGRSWPRDRAQWLKLAEDTGCRIPF